MYRRIGVTVKVAGQGVRGSVSPTGYGDVRKVDLFRPARRFTDNVVGRSSRNGAAVPVDDKVRPTFL